MQEKSAEQVHHPYYVINNGNQNVSYAGKNIIIMYDKSMNSTFLV